jgi:hypothetical protein
MLTILIPHHDIRLADGRRLRYERSWHPIPTTIDGAAYLTPNGLRVIATLDPTRHGVLLHVSLSYRAKHPTWEEITSVKAAFFGPDMDAVMFLPKEKDFVHGIPGWEDSHVFHLWQCPTTWEDI